MRKHKSISDFPIHKAIVAIVALVIFQLAAGAEDVPDITDLMTSEELDATGVALLSDTQIEALNAWLQRFRDNEINEMPQPSPVNVDANDSRVVANPPAEVSDVYPPPRQRVEIHSRIAGEFQGWDGQTRFTLENGQIWEQRRRGRWKTSLSSPEVRLYQNFLGAWELEIVEPGRTTGVRRIR